MNDQSIVMLAGCKSSTNIVYNALQNDFRIEKVIMEARLSKIRFLKRRARRLGVPKVTGQILFRAIVVLWLKLSSRQRLLKLREKLALNDAAIDNSKIVYVESVNSEETKAILQTINPALVVINGTRIIAEDILHCIPAKFINMHAGITPLYRGVHGAYWALVEGNKKACGVTVHLVDAGIDTGSILACGIIEPEKEDNLVTYPLLQLAAGLPLLKRTIWNALNGRVETQSPPEGPSRLWSHPTLVEYFMYRIRFGVK